MTLCVVNLYGAYLILGIEHDVVVLARSSKGKVFAQFFAAKLIEGC